MAKKIKENHQNWPALGRMFSWMDKAGSADKLFWGLAIVCLLVGLMDFAYEKHTYFDVEYLPNFYGFFGFVAFSFIIFAAKALRVLIKQPEDYYGSQAIDREEYPPAELERKDHGDD